MDTFAIFQSVEELYDEDRLTAWEAFYKEIEEEENDV